METPNDSARTGVRSTRVPIVLALMIVAAVVATYLIYVKGKREYFVHRNLRILGSLSRQLDDAFLTQATFVRNYAHARGGWKPEDQNKLLPGFDVSFDCAPQGSEVLSEPATLGDRLSKLPGRETAERFVDPREDGNWLQVVWAGMVPTRTTKAKVADSAPAPAVSEKPIALCRQVPLARVLEPLLNREIFGAFDSVFLAFGDGRILYSVSPKHSPSTLLWPSAQKKSLQAGGIVSPKLVLTSLAKLEEPKLWGEPTEISFGSLRDTSRHANVRIANDDYVLFTQPYLFRQATTKSGFGNWVVGGLIAKERFRSETGAISASKAVVAITLCVLAVCAWPFLRIALLTPRQALKITDAALVITCSVVGVILITLMILDSLAYQRLSDQSDAQLRAFAYKVDRDFTKNVISASRALDAIKEWSKARSSTVADDWNLLAKKLDGDADATKLFDDKAVAAHPYWTSFFWIDRDGVQRYKASTRARTPLLDVSKRRYFTDARDQRTWDALPKSDGYPRHPYALEWVQSMTTGETQAVIAKRVDEKDGNKNLPVIALSTQLIDVSLAVPPPGVAFAIVDEQGNVIYHADEQRIDREDFFAETDFDRELRAAVLGRTDIFVTSAYWGEDQRMFVHPLPNTPWTLIAFRGKRLVRAINVQALLLTLLLLMFNSLPYVLVALAVLAVAPWYRAPSLWPDPRRTGDYTRLASILALASIAMSLSIYALEPRSGNLFQVVLLLPAQAMLSCWILLHKHDLRRWTAVAFCGWVALTGALLYFLATSQIDTGLLFSGKPQRMRALLIAVVLFAGVVALKLMTKENVEDEPADAPPSRWRRWLLPLWATPYRRIGMIWIASLTAILVAYGAFDGTTVALTALGAVLQAVLASIYILQTEDRSVLVATWCAVTLALLLYVAFQTSWLTLNAWGEYVVPNVFFFASICGVAFADGRRALKAINDLRRKAKPMRYPASYRMAGVLALVVGAVLPTLGYFKLGGRIEQEALIKYAQLRLATRLESRMNRIGELVCVENEQGMRCLDSKNARDAGLRYRMSNVWDTLWSLEDAPPPRRPAVAPAPALIVHEVLADLIPQYSEDSVAMRQLYTLGSADRLWQWNGGGRTVNLDRLVRLEPAAAKALWPHARDIHQQTLRFSSYVPLLFPSTFSPGNLRTYVASPLILTGTTSSGGMSGGDVGYTIFCLVIFALFCALLFWIVRFITDRVLLLNVQEPEWIATDSAVIADHVFLTRREKLKSVVGEADSDLVFDVRFAQLERKKSWNAELRRIDRSPARSVRIVDFEYGLDDDAISETKLSWLERLLRRSDRTVRIVSEVSPQFVLSQARAELAPRWHALLDKFLWLTWEEIAFRRAERTKLVEAREREEWSLQTVIDIARDPGRHRDDADARWVDEETASSPFLRSLARQIDKRIEREQFLDELRERAETYYEMLWSRCILDEKILLFHLARNGFVHDKNRRILRRLIARGLVRRSPNVELLSRSFQLYVLTAAERENLPAEVKRVEGESPWNALRVPLFIVVISFLLLLFATQKDLLTVTTGLAAAMTTGLPMLVNLFGVFAQKRTNAGAQAKSS